MSELKPCPFCGGRASEVHDALSAKFGYPKSVKCNSCYASHIHANGWNNRPVSILDKFNKQGNQS